MDYERVFEISGNLVHILNYDNFEKTICQVRNRFIELFGKRIMSSIQLSVDNATSMSGHTPIITPILGKYLCIKLGVTNFSNTEEIIFEFSHELCHYVFYALRGLDKTIADEKEEAVCTAMSLCILKDFYEDIQRHIDYVKGLENFCYRNGATIAESVNYESNKLFLIVLKEAENVR